MLYEDLANWFIDNLHNETLRTSLLCRRITLFDQVIYDSLFKIKQDFIDYLNNIFIRISKKLDETSLLLLDKHMNLGVKLKSVRIK